MEPLTREEIESIGLPKWPAIVVAGETIPRELAYEILIRTSGLYFSCNDREWERFCYKAFDLIPRLEKKWELPGETPEQQKARWKNEQDHENAVHRAFRVLRLSYLGNHRIAAAYIGGPYGWLDWDGQIGCKSFNIGKWPSTDAVFDEWMQIAQAWPTLTLACQLYNREQCEDGGEPVIEYRVREGTVAAYRPERVLTTDRSGSTFEGIEASVRAIQFHQHRERGCSPQVLLEAIKVTKEAVSKLPPMIEEPDHDD